MSIEWYVEHLDRDGKVIWSDKGVNSLALDGENFHLTDLYRGQTSQVERFYIALVNYTPTKTSVMNDLTGEPNGLGYERQLIERDATGFPTLALDAGDYQITSKTVTFTASGGNWSTVTYAILTNLWGVTWTANTSKSIGDWVRPTSPNKHLYKCTTGGTTGSTEPTWPTNGGTVNDGTVTWQDMGTGLLISYFQLSTPRTLADGESLNCTLKVKQTTA